jgi:hypothetical protein
LITLGLGFAVSYIIQSIDLCNGLSADRYETACIEVSIIVIIVHLAEVVSVHEGIEHP